jgi:hypothetical protein
MHAPISSRFRIPHWREASHYLTSFLALTAQRNALLKPCATFLLESRLVQGFCQFCIPAGITLASTHSLSGATTEVSPAAGSKNPASGQVGTTFTWFFTSTGAHRAQSYTVSGLPGGLTYKYGSPVASITGKPTTAGTSRITIKGWENSNRTGASTPVYTLTLNVTSPAPVITALSPGGEFAAGAPINLSVTATGANLTYQWKLNDVAVSGATSSTYSIPSLSESTAGSYTVVVASGAATVTSAAIVVAVKPAMEAWKSTYWSGSDLSDALISGPEADPDGDGLENVLEYVLELNPTSFTPDSAGALGPDPSDAQYLLYQVPLNPLATDYTVRFQRSTDLAAGVWTTVDETDPATLVTRTPTLLTLKMPRSEGRSFVRLISTLP